MDRRKFVKMMGLAGAAAAVPWRLNLRRMRLESARALAFAQSPTNLRKFVDSLPGLGPNKANTLGQYLTVMTPDTTTFPGSDYYKEVALQGSIQMHSDLPGPTTFWGYCQDKGTGVATDQKYLGGVIVSQKDRPVRVTMRNALPPNHFLPMDKTYPMWMGQPMSDPMTGLPILDANGNPQQAVRGAGQPPYAWGQNRICVHLHGGFPPWISDGTPFQDFDPNGGYGASAWQSPYGLLVPPDMVNKTPPGSFSLYWTNQQAARFLWYHDHTMDSTRLNPYAGLATGYVITDNVEAKLINASMLPSPANTIYLVFQDKTFKSDGNMWYPYQYEINPSPPGVSPPWGTPNGRWDWSGPPSLDPSASLNTLSNPSLIPEAFFDTPVINGCAYPYLEVEQRHYRFRVLNGANARFFNLQLYFADPANPTEVKMVPANGATYNGPYGPVTVPNDLRYGGVPDPTMAGPAFTVIGNECGFLPAPTLLNNPPKPIAFDTNITSLTFGNATAWTLVLAPAERTDFIIDFSTLPVGAKLILYTDAPGPFPMGDPRNDYFTGDQDYTVAANNTDGIGGGAPITQLGMGPNTRTLMQFRVKARTGAADSPAMNNMQLMAQKNLKNAIFPPITPLPTSGVPVRQLTLNETFETADNWPTGTYGRLIQFMGDTKTDGTDQWGVPMFYDNYTGVDSGAGQVVKAGTTEVWEIFNLTGDTHPIHFHLVNVQVINRQTFDVAGYMAKALTVPIETVVDPNPFLVGSPRPPDRNELGYKETIRMNPNEVTRVVMKFDLPKVPFPVPLSNRLLDPMMQPGITPDGIHFNTPLNAYEYVMHCHILEHEEHDMMQVLSVKP